MLRLIAIDRALHFVVLGVLAALAFTLASHRTQLTHLIDRLNSLFYGSRSGSSSSPHGLPHEIERLLTLNVNTYRLIGVAAAAYAALEGSEAYGLWRQRRWAEYLTFVATTLFVPYEIYELVGQADRVPRSARSSINLAILLYLLSPSGCSGCGGARRQTTRRASATRAGKPSSS